MFQEPRDLAAELRVQPETLTHRLAYPRRSEPAGVVAGQYAVDVELAQRRVTENDVERSRIGLRRIVDRSQADRRQRPLATEVAQTLDERIVPARRGDGEPFEIREEAERQIRGVRDVGRIVTLAIRARGAESTLDLGRLEV